MHRTAIVPAALLALAPLAKAQSISQTRSGLAGNGGLPEVSPCLQLGAAVAARTLAEDPIYEGVVRDWMQISSFTVETFHKFRLLRFGPDRTDYDFSVADELIERMKGHGLGREGMVFHTLFWHNRFPLDPWVETLGFVGARNVIREHVDTIHEHYYEGPAAHPINQLVSR